MEKEELGHKLRVHIVSKYRTQSEAAKHWGVSDAYVSRIIRGHSEPTDVMLEEIGLKRVESKHNYVKVRK